MSSFDAVVVGGGLIGGSIAFELARHRLRVLLLDRKQPGLEASWAAAGMLAPSPESRTDAALVPLGKASLELYPEFVAAIEEASGQAVGFRADGTIRALFGPDAERELNAMLELHRAVALPAEAISPEEARRIEPALNPATRAAALLRYEARVDNRALTEAVLRAASAHGAEIHAGRAVTSLTLEKNRCVGVRVGEEQISGGWAVMAAGCYTGGITPLERYAPTRPVRGQMVALRAPHVEFTGVVRSARGYIVPRDDGRLVAGSTLESAGFEKRVTPAGLGQILGAAVELVPALTEASIVETWSGLRPDTPDHLPVLGPTDLEGLVIATGHYRNGILLAPITAKLLREWVTHRRTSISLERFSPLRFLERTRGANTQ